MARITTICIGNELLIGDTLNTNLAFIGSELASAGYELDAELCVPDTPAAIRRALETALAENDLVLTVGGLGPTEDDITRNVVADVLQLPLVHDQRTEDHIRALLAGRNIAVPEQAILTQCMVPSSADVLTNLNGSAPGLWCTSSRGVVVMMPGPPRELKPMFAADILPRIRKNWAPDYACRVIRVVGMGESSVEEAIRPVLDRYPDADVAYCAKPEAVTVRLSVRSLPENCLDQAEKDVRGVLAQHALPADCTCLAEAVGRLLLEKGWWLATAESCTGGGIAAAITDISGSSQYFRGGIVSYSNEWKHSELGVAQQTLLNHGAVSEETIGEMLDGTLAKLGVDAVIAVSGIAGPGGGTAGKPVGLVYIGIAVKDRRRIQHCIFPGDRNSVRMRTVQTSLRMLRDELLDVNG